MSFAGTVWLVMRKDLRIEIRSREILYTTLFFAVACVLVFAFGFVREGRPLEDASAGILWIAIAFSGTLALGRARLSTSASCSACSCCSPRSRSSSFR
jgi:ABC-type transport system involved in cytochrome c biogenesis permease component